MLMRCVLLSRCISLLYLCFLHLLLLIYYMYTFWLDKNNPTKNTQQAKELMCLVVISMWCGIVCRRVFMHAFKNDSSTEKCVAWQIRRRDSSHVLKKLNILLLLLLSLSLKTICSAFYMHKIHYKVHSETDISVLPLSVILRRFQHCWGNG